MLNESFFSLWFNRLYRPFDPEWSFSPTRSQEARGGSPQSVYHTSSLESQHPLRRRERRTAIIQTSNNNRCSWCSQYREQTTPYPRCHTPNKNKAWAPSFPCFKKKRLPFSCPAIYLKTGREEPWTGICCWSHVDYDRLKKNTKKGNS